jgi:hypothetical protein
MEAAPEADPKKNRNERRAVFLLYGFVPFSEEGRMRRAHQVSGCEGLRGSTARNKARAEAQ